MGRKRLRDRHLPERVYHKHGAYYFVNVEKAWIRLGTTMAEMYQALANMQIEQGQVSTMGQLLDRYLREVVPGKKPATRRSNEISIGFLRRFFGDIKVGEVTTPDVFQYRDLRSLAGKTTANRDLEVLSHTFSKAIEWGVIGNDKHPMRGLRIKNTTRARDRYVTDDELDIFLSHCSDLLKAYIGLKRLTGLSKADLLAMRMDQITSDGISYTRSKTEGRGAKRKLIERTPELTVALDACIKLRGRVSGMTLFCTRDGQPYRKEDGKTSGFDSIWQRTMAKAVADGIPRFTEHDLRAKVASETDLEHAQELLDHTNPAITNRVYRRAPVKVQPAKAKGSPPQKQ